MTLGTVKVPPKFEQLFSQAEDYVKNYFSSFLRNPQAGTITIGGERYILVRAASMSVYFFDHIKNMYPALSEQESVEAAYSVLFDIAHTIGKNDAAAFHKATYVSDPIAKLATGPIHFAYSGWAFVDIHSESILTPDENYYLLYDHPNSFEADEWLTHRGKTTFSVCFMNAGYSAGWCEESFGIELQTREVMCRAKGDPHCRFIMAPPAKIQERVNTYFANHTKTP